METAECPIPVPFRESIGVTVFIAWLFYLTFVGRIIFGPMMPIIEQELQISHSQAGTLFLMIAGGQFIGQVFSGLLSSRINHRGSLMVSVLLLGMSLMGFAIIRSVTTMRIFLFFTGLAGGLHIPSAIATITAEVRPSDWGKALGVHQTAPPLSFASAPLIAAALIIWFSWRTILVSLGLFSLITIAAYWSYGRGGLFPGKLPSPVLVKTILGKGSFWIMVLLFAMAMGATAGLFAMMPLFLVNERGMDFSAANTLVGLSQISGLFMAFCGGWIADRFGQRATIAALLLMAGMCTLLIGTLQGIWMRIFIFLQPALITAFYPAAFAAVSRIAPPSMRSVSNALAPSTAFLIGGGLIPALIGYAGEVGTFALGISLLGCFIMAGPLLVIFLRLGQYDKEDGC
jgi:NNP family nitrate/nitrite transporter-like MFS transporter